MQRKLRAFYTLPPGYPANFVPDGVRCVVTGETSTWHHLDDNHRNHALANIVPLAPLLNSHLGGVKGGASGPSLWLDPRLHPDMLLLTAETHFRNWQVSHAFGCAHLAFFLGGPSYAAQSGSDRLAAMRSSLLYARHSYSKEIIEYIVAREFAPIVSDAARQLTDRDRELTLQEICALLGENGDAELASELSSRLMIYSGMPPLEQASLLRRKAQSLGLSQPHNLRVGGLLKDALEVAGNNLNQVANNANTLAFISFASSLKRTRSKSYDDLSLLFEGVRKHTQTRPGVVAMTASNAAGIAMNLAVLESIVKPKGRHRNRGSAIERAQILLPRSGAALWNLWPGCWRQLLREISDCGGHPGELASLVERHRRESLSRKTVNSLVRTARLLLDR